MADPHLIFGRPPHPGGPVHLVFGAGLPAPPPAPVSAAGASVLGGVQSSGLVVYDNRNPRGAGTSAGLPHQPATPARREMDARHQPANVAARETDARHQTAGPAGRATAAPWAMPAKMAAERSAPWLLGEPMWAAAGLPHESAALIRAGAAGTWALAVPTGISCDLAHERAALMRIRAAGYWQTAQSLHALGHAPHRTGVRRAARLLAPWETARTPPPGRESWPPTGPAPRPPRVPSTHLVFACPPWAGGAVHLVFGHSCINPGPIAGLYILPASYYMAVHQLEAHRLPDLQPVPIFGVSLAADAGSFGWSFSAMAPASVFEQLAPASGLPARLRITLDGLAFEFVVDSLQREESFGKRGVRIAGRSATALLARPYARETARLSAAPATAQQLAEAALEFSGASLDWGLTDWLVPAGAWSHTGTPLAAVQTIVEAAGGYLQSQRTGATLLARHPYPELPGGLPGGPWNWYASGVTPDVELAPDAIITSGIERRDGPDINAVHVSGTTQGVLALVKRTGSAADKLAGLITDPLITAGEAALQRGLSVLGAAGPKHIVSISLPVLTGPAQPGVLDVGQLVQINTATPWRGRVRSVSVGADFGREVRQTVQIERHLEAA